MEHTPHPELYKAREIRLARLPPRNLAYAARVLGAVARVETRPDPATNCIVVAYDLRDHTLQKLENLLVAAGCHLDNSLLRKIGRALIHHCEACLLENFRAPGRDDHLRRIYLNSSPNKRPEGAPASPEELTKLF